VALGAQAPSASSGKSVSYGQYPQDKPTRTARSHATIARPRPPSFRCGSRAGTAQPRHSGRYGTPWCRTGDQVIGVDGRRSCPLPFERWRARSGSGGHGGEGLTDHAHDLLRVGEQQQVGGVEPRRSPRCSAPIAQDVIPVFAGRLRRYLLARVSAISLRDLDPSSPDPLCIDANGSVTRTAR
jgi:hypothetical protein